MAMGVKATCNAILDRIGRYFARKLNAPASGYKPYMPSAFRDITSNCTGGRCAVGRRWRANFRGNQVPYAINVVASSSLPRQSCTRSS